MDHLPKRGASADDDTMRTAFSNPAPGHLSLPETAVRGKILRIDDDGFGIVVFDRQVGAAELGFFTSKTEMVNRQSREVKVGTAVAGVLEAVEMQIPEAAGPLTLPLKKLELVP